MNLAEENHNKALKLQISHYGPDHHELSCTYLNFGIMYHA